MQSLTLRFLTVGIFTLGATGGFASEPNTDDPQLRGGVYYRSSGFPVPAFVECVEGTKCDSHWGNGECRDYARYEVCGYTCATGKTCDNRWFNGTCRDWNIDAACGSACIGEQVCDNRWFDGTCREFAVKVTCQQY
jgi:hypothetical protein